MGLPAANYTYIYINTQRIYIIANALLSTWAAKFLVDAARLARAADIFSATLGKGFKPRYKFGEGGERQAAYNSLINNKTVMLAMRAELVGILSLAGVNAGDAQKILSSLDIILASIKESNKGFREAPKNLLKTFTTWFNQYIKPLL